MQHAPEAIAASRLLNLVFMRGYAGEQQRLFFSISVLARAFLAWTELAAAHQKLPAALMLHEWKAGMHLANEPRHGRSADGAGY
eukprot:1160722-Pelagomonas_calceolata.AAC.11